MSGDLKALAAATARKNIGRTVRDRLRSKKVRGQIKENKKAKHAAKVAQEAVPAVPI